jgi:hypothetical protein
MFASTAALIRAGAAPAWLARLGMPARLVSHTGRVYTIGAWPADEQRTQIASGAPRPDPRPTDALQQGTARPPTAV